MPVNTERKDYAEMLPKWKRLRDCYEGRDAILKGGAAYAPDLPGADTAANAAYRARGNFYNATQRTVQGLAGAIFQRPPDVKFPTTFEEYLEDITLSGVNFEAFAGDAGRDVMTTGRYGILIDMPAEKTPTARPYVIGYKAEDIINWRTERIGGDDELTMIVLHEVVETTGEKDPFVCESINQYRVIELTDAGAAVQLWREQGNASKQYLEFGERTLLTRRGTALDFIPFVFIGSTHATPDLERPPLLDLADVNLAHWRNSVDHEYGLHLVALPTPWVAGVRSASVGAMKIGPSVIWELDVQGSAGMLEFSGSGLAAIVTALEDKKTQMSTLGARLLEEPVRGDTATAVLIRHAGEQASLRTIAGAIEQGFSMILQMLAWWAGTDADWTEVDANVELNKEYLDVKATSQEIQVALTALQAGEISFKTWWEIISTGGWGREGIDASTERDEINKQKSLAPEPTVDPALSPDDPATPAAPAKPATKTVKGPDGQVKYTIEG